MKYLAHILAAVSLVLVLILAAATYNMNGKLTYLAANQGSNSSSVAGDLTKARTAMDKMRETVKNLQQNLDQYSADSKQNAAAIEDIKKRINRLIDLIK